MSNSVYTSKHYFYAWTWSQSQIVLNWDFKCDTPVRSSLHCFGRAYFLIDMLSPGVKLMTLTVKWNTLTWFPHHQYLNQVLRGLSHRMVTYCQFLGYHDVWGGPYGLGSSNMLPRHSDSRTYAVARWPCFSEPIIRIQTKMRPKSYVHQPSTSVSHIHSSSHLL